MPSWFHDRPCSPAASNWAAFHVCVTSRASRKARTFPIATWPTSFRLDGWIFIAVTRKPDAIGITVTGAGVIPTGIDTMTALPTRRRALSKAWLIAFSMDPNKARA